MDLGLSPNDAYTVGDAKSYGRRGYGLSARLIESCRSNSMKEKHMKIDSRTVGDIYFLDCSGKITLGEGTMSVRNAVRDILKTGGKKIVLNLADVNYIDSPGVGELVSTYTTVVSQGGQLKLLSLTKKVQEVMAITRLLTVFQAYDNETATISSFA
jgi:anti-sigma B factor antagonist